MSHATAFLTAPLGQVLLRTAAPIILVMTLSGSQNIIDAVFLGQLVGPDAVAAVGAIFPVIAASIALQTMVGSGMASRLARMLGARDLAAAQSVFASAHGLALACAAVLILAFVLLGHPLTLALAGGDPAVAQMARSYLSIVIAASSVTFWLGVHVDALRSEGRATLMAGLSVLVTLANIALTYVLMGWLGLGVAGSALGTVAAQGLALALALAVRLRLDTPLPVRMILACPWWGGWGRILTLGAPLSLNFFGLALMGVVILSALQLTGVPGYVSIVAAYGLITRLMGFAFLPLMGLAQAMQAVVGNNLGAGLHARSDRALWLSLAAALIYCIGIETLFIVFAPRIGALFVSDPAIIDQLSRILQVVILAYALAGPVLILALYFQAAGQAGRAALLTLSKPYILQPVLIVVLALTFGEPGIWLAGPTADCLLFGLAATLWWRLRTPGTAGFGLQPGA